MSVLLNKLETQEFIQRELKTSLRKPEARLRQKIKLRPVSCSAVGNSDADDYKMDPGTGEAFCKRITH